MRGLALLMASLCLCNCQPDVEDIFFDGIRHVGHDKTTHEEEQDDIDTPSTTPTYPSPSDPLPAPVAPAEDGASCAGNDDCASGVCCGLSSDDPLVDAVCWGEETPCSSSGWADWCGDMGTPYVCGKDAGMPGGDKPFTCSPATTTIIGSAMASHVSIWCCVI